MEHNPIKRSEQLAPLSREHHEGLLFVWKIRQGLKNNTPINSIGEVVQWFWENHLEKHFKQEEQLLVPYLSENDQIKRMVDEHQEIEALIHINNNITDEAMLHQIADVANDHIRFEERELFPFIEQQLTREQLDSIYAQLTAEKEPSPVWENEFWTTKK